MNLRWYISTLVIILSVLGGFSSQQQSSVPNQEVVLQFTGEHVSHEDTQNAIANVKQQLQHAGAENIKVVEQDNGQLKITYYSTSDVTNIKKQLSQDNVLDLGVTAFDDKSKSNKLPSSNTSIDYNVDVYEIHSNYDIGLSGKLAVELKSDHDRLINPNVFAPSYYLNIDATEHLRASGYVFRRYIANAIDKYSYKIPEVRAGPLA